MIESFDLKFSKYILFLSLLGLASACSLTKNLQEGEYVVYESDIEGVEKANEEEISPKMHSGHINRQKTCQARKR